MTTATIENRLRKLEAKTEAAGGNAPADPAGSCVLIIHDGETAEEAARRQGGGPFLFAWPDNGRGA